MNATNFENGNAVAEYDESDVLQRRYVQGKADVDERAVLLGAWSGRSKIT